MRSKMLMFIAAALATAVPAFAGGGDKGSWEIGPYGGYVWADDYGSFHPKNNFVLGGRLGYFLNPSWNLEVAAQRTPTETDAEESAFPNRDVKLDAARMNLLYNFAPGSKFRPFLSVGGGRERTEIEGFDKANDWSMNAGGGMRVYLSERFNFRADARYSGNKVSELVPDRQNNIEATAGLNLTFGGADHEDVEPEQPKPDQPPLVSCTTDRAEVLPGENVAMIATATDPEGEPLTYTWTTTAGSVTGTGSNVGLDLSSATPPATATVTVQVSDPHGNTATSQCAVKLLEPVRQAEAVSCLANGFPRNLARLTNVDKACLDDVAQKLKADPRSRVIVVGHADPQEKSADDVGKQRANAVEDYLQSAGIDASRITTHSAGSSRPVSADEDMMAQARNRRVEVWFVPDGAKEPDYK